MTEDGAHETLNVRVVRQPTDKVTLIVGLVAVLALVVSLWQGFEVQRHFRLSLRPHLDFESYFVESAPYMGIGMLNGGTGPALIENILLAKDGVPVDTEVHNGWIEILADLNLRSSGRFYKVFHKGDVFEPNRKQRVYGFGVAAQTTENRDALRTMVRRIVYGLCYCSLYDECWWSIGGYPELRQRTPVGDCEGDPPAVSPSWNWIIDVDRPTTEKARAEVSAVVKYWNGSSWIPQPGQLVTVVFSLDTKREEMREAYTGADGSVVFSDIPLPSQTSNVQVRYWDPKRTYHLVLL